MLTFRNIYFIHCMLEQNQKNFKRLKKKDELHKKIVLVLIYLVMNKKQV